MRDLRGDVIEVIAQGERTRTRLHNLEGFAQAYLDTQKANRRQEDSQYRRMGNRIAFAGVAVSVGMFALAVVTALAHYH